MKSFVLRVSLYADPDVWRVMEVPSTLSLADLHAALERAFTWEEGHLYSFFLGEAWEPEGWCGGPGSGAPAGAAAISLDRLGLDEDDSFLYLHDFHQENWHEVRVEEARPEAGSPWPTVAEARGRVPRPPRAGEGEERPPTAAELDARAALARRIEELAARMYALIEDEDDEVVEEGPEADLEEECRLALEALDWCGGREGRLAGLGLGLGLRETDFLVSDWMLAVVEALYEAGAPEAALELARKCAEVTRAADFLAETAILLAATGAWPEAVAQAEANRERFPRDPWVHLKAADIYDALGLGSRAAACLDHALDLCEDPLMEGMVLDAFSTLYRVHGYQEVPDEGRGRLQPPRAGRNDPCPCGSGRKHKKCCAGRPHFGPGPEVRARNRLLDEAFDRAVDVMFTPDLEEALEYYFGFSPEGETNEEALLGIEPACARDLFIEWLLLDFTKGSEDTFLEDLQALRRLDAVESAVLARSRDSHVGFYQVLEVRRGEGLCLWDVLDGGRVEVADALASRTLYRWDLVATRLMEMDGALRIAGSILTYGPEIEDMVLSCLHRAAEEYRKWSSGAGWPEVLKIEARAFQKAFEIANPEPWPEVPLIDGRRPIG